MGQLATEREGGAAAEDPSLGARKAEHTDDGHTWGACNLRGDMGVAGRILVSGKVDGIEPLDCSRQHAGAPCARESLEAFPRSAGPVAGRDVRRVSRVAPPSEYRRVFF